MRRTGFAVVVVSRSGDLLAYGRGIPPDWVRDAAGAEAWAFAVILQLCPTLPEATTDCLNIVNTVAEGKGRATSAKSTLARIWCQAFHCMDERAYEKDDPHGLK